mgnify:CR=1 FL=1
MPLQRVEVLKELMATATPAQLEAAGTAAARRSVEFFHKVVNTLCEPGADAYKHAILMVEMQYVGIKCEGRSGPYDLMYFPHNNTIYAADSRDDAIVYAAHDV